jgi:RimJ/RimL family protein N-acetyltransferase
MREMELASSIFDYMDVRRIRNENSRWLTGNPNKIGIWQQLKFYWSKPKNIELYVCREFGSVVAYMLLRHEAETCFITEVVDVLYRGENIASDMILFAQFHYPNITAEILNSNVASIRLHEKMGFKLVSESEHKLTYNWRHNDN